MNVTVRYHGIIGDMLRRKTQQVAMADGATVSDLLAAIPHAYIFCTEEKGTAEEDPQVRVAERVRSDPAWSFQEIAANHLVLVNDPQATAEALLSLV